MNFIVSEFVNLIRGVPTGWLWKRRYGSGESSYSARLSLRLWKIMMLNWPGSMRESRKLAHGNLEQALAGVLSRMPLNTRKEYKNAVAGDLVRQE